MLNDSAASALLGLLQALTHDGYAFVSITPASHARIIRRRSEGETLRDVFGWNLPFLPAAIPARYLDLLQAAGALEGAVDEHGRVRSRVRVSSLDGALFLHSAYPTSGESDIFFGPDTYRYVNLIREELPALGPVSRIVDLGAGTGAGGIMAARLAPGARVTLTDINRKALDMAAINAAKAGTLVDLVEATGLDDVEGAVDLVIANPPYIMDDDDRAYRNGGGMHGAALSFEWATAVARRLASGGNMILYTGVSIIDGQDELRSALDEALPDLGCTLRYREIDPDVFGEELDKPQYRDVERIAAIGAVITKKG